MAVGAGGAAAVARWRRRREAARDRDRDKDRPPPARKAEPRAPGEWRVGDVLLHLSDEYWLAGELSLLREGSTVVRLFSAPERGSSRWLAVPRAGDSVYVLHADATLAALGWPGMEVPLRGATLRPLEQGNCAIAVQGEVEARWEGLGRYGVFRALETVALVLEQGGQRLALSGKAVPRRLLEKLG